MCADDAQPTLQREAGVELLARARLPALLLEPATLAGLKRAENKRGMIRTAPSQYARHFAHFAHLAHPGLSTRGSTNTKVSNVPSMRDTLHAQDTQPPPILLTLLFLLLLVLLTVHVYSSDVYFIPHHSTSLRQP